MGLSPGVYVKEVPSGVHAIAAVSTSLTAFIGVALRGPVNVLTRVQSMATFNRTFGDVDPSSEMSFAVQQFFVNGGSDALVVRVAANAHTARCAVTAAGGGPSLMFTAGDGGNAGNGIAVATDAVPGDPNRFVVTVTGLPDRSGTIATERFSGLSMRRTDPRFVETVINGGSALVTVRRDPAASFSAGFSSNGAGPAAFVVDATHQTLRVSVDGRSPLVVTLPVAATIAVVRSTIAAVVAGSASVTGAGNGITITSNSSGETSSVVVLPGLAGDASRMLGLGLAAGGVEVDGSASAQPAPSPAAGSLSVDTTALTAATLTHHADGNIALTLDGGRPVTIPLAVSDISADFALFAARIQAAVRGFRPTVDAYARFTAGFDSVANRLVLSSGTRGPASSVSVANAAPNTLAADLGLVAGVQAAGGAQVLAGGSEDALTPAVTYATFVPPPASKGGLYALENADIFNLLCLPGITDGSTLQDAAAYCESRRAFLIVDPPPGQAPTDVEALLNGPTLPKSDHAAMYYPNVMVTDPGTGAVRLTAPSGTVAGIYARTDGTRGVWKAPAGTETNLVGAQALEYVMTDGENSIINPLGANAIRQFRPYGIVCWGARTLNGSDNAASDYKYVPVRRLALFMEQSLYDGTQWIVFEPNDERLWAQIRLSVGSFMNTLFRQGAFQGTSTREAYFVKCDGETTQQADIDLGVVNILVGFAPLKPAEFVMISIQQMAGQLAV